MMSFRWIVALALVVVGVVFTVVWVGSIRGGKRPSGRESLRPSKLETAIGFVTNFFDTLGIGSFAPTTSVFKLKHVVPDERMPGTLNVGHTPPVIVQAVIYIAIIAIDPLTLVALIGAAVLGAWLGAGVVAGWPRRRIQIGMGTALLLAAVFFVMTNVGLFPSGGEALTLRGAALGVGVVGNFVLGALMTLGIGLYAPCMILISLLGMSPITAFPIMMGSCAFLMPVGSVRFIRAGAYSLRPALGLALGGVPAVLLAAYIVKSLPLTALRWLVTGVVLYTAVAMLRSAYVEATQCPAVPEELSGAESVGSSG
jgi:uncharacterized membrane protein YfcA